MQALSQIIFYSPDAPVNPVETSTGKVSSATATIGSVTLSDVWDTINPLEHIPFVSTLYDAITGNTPSAGAKIAGGALYGGPLGVISSAINLAFEGETGYDMAGSVIASVIHGGGATQVASTSPPQLADASTPAATASADSTATDAIVQSPVAEILPPTKAGNAPAIAAQQRTQDVLSLFDAPNAAANSAYRRAQSLTAPATTSGGSLVM